MKSYFAPICALAACVVTLSPLVQGQGNLSLSPESDALSIAQRLYEHAVNPSNTPEERHATLQRAAERFSDFIIRFPRSKEKNRAQYMLATCYLATGDEAKCYAQLKSLVNMSSSEYAVAAAYKLGTQATKLEKWTDAVKYFSFVLKNGKRLELLHDSRFRLAHAYQKAGKLNEADEMYQQLFILKDVPQNLLQAALFSLAQMKVESGEDEKAYGYFTRLLSQPALAADMKSRASLQAARLASKLGKNKEANQIYSSLSGSTTLGEYYDDVQLELIVSLSRDKDYLAIVRHIAKHYIQLKDLLKEAQRALLVGQAFMVLEKFNEADYWFEHAETLQPNTSIAMDAAYRRIVCAQQVRNPELTQLSEAFLNRYARNSSSAQSPLNDYVRLIYATRLMQVDLDAATRQFEAINIDKLPKYLQEEALYRKAWSAMQGAQIDPLPSLELYVSKYPQGAHFPVVLTMRADALVKQGKLDAAIADYQKVVKHFPKNALAPICLQRAAKACEKAGREKDMLEFYKKLVNLYPSIKPAALASAYYNMGKAMMENDTQNAISCFLRAREIDGKLFRVSVDINLVQCYVKMQNDVELVKVLQDLNRCSPEDYNKLPASYFRWCGWMRFQKNDYKQAHYYLKESLKREGQENYQAADGSTMQRAKTEPLVWKTLAKACLEIADYQYGLEAANHYISMEKHAYRKAEGMRDAALLLIALGRNEDAKKIVEEAISMGVDGPIKSTLFITLGDAFFAEKNYKEAAKYYGRTANVVSDLEIKPIALYKISQALKKGDKKAESEQYEVILKNEFPLWKPSAALRRQMLVK